MSNFKNSVIRIYCLLVVAVLAIVIINAFTRSVNNMNYGLEFSYSIEEDWKDDNGRQFDFENLNQYAKDENGYVSAYYMTSDKLTEGDSIIFKSIDCNVKFLIDKKIVYETQQIDAKWNNKSPGSRWNLVRIENVSEPHYLQMKIKPVYSFGCQIDNVVMGDRALLILDVITGCLPEILISVILFIMGFVCLAFAISINLKRDGKEISVGFGIGYFGIFIILGSVWSLAETYALQFISSQFIQVSLLAQLTYMIGSIPLLLYLNSTYEIFRFKAARVLAMVDCIYIFLALVLHMTNVSDIHNAMFGTIIIYIMICITIILCVMKSGHRIVAPNNSINVHVVLRNIGLVIYNITMIIDVIRFVFNCEDKARASRIGLLVIVILIGVGTVYHSIILVQTGLKSEFISHLAYTDGLTEVGNRTAYNERIDSIIEENNGGVGFVIFDVNNLKKINDTLGHAEGDALICGATNLIKEAFGRHGKIYRTGGDEFACIIYDDEARQLYEDGISVFYKKMKEYNNRKGIRFSIVVAHGFAFSEDSSEESVREALFTADKLMYVNKAEMKQLFPLKIYDEK